MPSCCGVSAQRRRKFSRSITSIRPLPPAARSRKPQKSQARAGSCGPGNLHLINGLFDCQRSRLPVLAIAAQIPSAELGAGYFQETHPENLFKECSNYCELISGANQMPRTLEIAIRQAVGNRGVSVVVIPGDVALQPAADAPLPKVAGLLPRQAVAVPAQVDVDRLA